MGRLRKAGIGMVARKLAIRLWSTRVALMIAAATDPQAEPAPSSEKIALSFVVMPSEALDGRELGIETARGGELLYVEGLLRMYSHGPGDALVARTTHGDLVAVGLLSYADHHEPLGRAAPGFYPAIAAEECWTEAHYVMPAYRNRHVMASMIDEERRYLRSRGIRRLLAIVDSANVPSLRAFARAGYQPTGVVRIDRYRLNRYSSHFTTLDERTRALWDRAADPRRQTA